LTFAQSDTLAKRRSVPDIYREANSRLAANHGEQFHDGAGFGGHPNNWLIDLGQHTRIPLPFECGVVGDQKKRKNKCSADYEESHVNSRQP
jgi:hypothetical protein